MHDMGRTVLVRECLFIDTRSNGNVSMLASLRGQAIQVTVLGQYGYQCASMHPWSEGQAGDLQILQGITTAVSVLLSEPGTPYSVVLGAGASRTRMTMSGRIVTYLVWKVRRR